MRGTGMVAGCVALALLVGGCDPTRDSRYLREGIGPDLYWDGLPAATQLQDIYLANICAQAISPFARSDVVSCDGFSLKPRDWGLLVQAGMNDIDLRCDAYLSWLYDRKSSKEPFLKELASVGGATAGILKATNVGATPIALTAIAFGLAADTFTNIDLRLVNAVDYTTVDSVVRDNRTQFRLTNLSLVIDNRPAAIYVLRNYLSICVPDSIEMSINNTVTVYHRGGPDALRMTPIGLRLAPATSSNSATIGAPITAQQTISKPERSVLTPHPEFATILDPYDPQVHSASYVMSIQQNLCVPRSEIGTIGPNTKALISIYQATKAATIPSAKNDGKLNAKEIGEVLGSGSCATNKDGQPTGPQNFFEKRTFRDNSTGTKALADFIAHLNKEGGTLLPADASLDAARDKIRQVRAKLLSGGKLVKLPPDLSDQVTPDLYKAELTN